MARPTKKNPTGAQKSPKFTPDRIDKLRHAFGIDCTVEEACLYASIDTATFYKWRKKHPKLFSEFELLRNNPVLKARQTAVKEATKNYQNAIDYLARKRKGEFSLRNEQAGPDGGPIPHKHELIGTTTKKYLGQLTEPTKDDKKD